MGASGSTPPVKKTRQETLEGLDDVVNKLYYYSDQNLQTSGPKQTRPLGEYKYEYASDTFKTSALAKSLHQFGESVREKLKDFKDYLNAGDTKALDDAQTNLTSMVKKKTSQVFYNEQSAVAFGKTEDAAATLKQQWRDEWVRDVDAGFSQSEKEFKEVIKQVGDKIEAKLVTKEAELTRVGTRLTDLETELKAVPPTDAARKAVIDTETAALLAEQKKFNDDKKALTTEKSELASLNTKITTDLKKIQQEDHAKELERVAKDIQERNISVAYSQWFNNQANGAEKHKKWIKEMYDATGKPTLGGASNMGGPGTYKSDESKYKMHIDEKGVLTITPLEKGNFGACLKDAIDFLMQNKAGISGIRLIYDKPEDVDLEDVKKAIKLCQDNRLVYEFDPAKDKHLNTVLANSKEGDKIKDLIRQTHTHAVSRSGSGPQAPDQKSELEKHRSDLEKNIKGKSKADYDKEYKDQLAAEMKDALVKRDPAKKSELEVKQDVKTSLYEGIMTDINSRITKIEAAQKNIDETLVTVKAQEAIADNDKDPYLKETMDEIDKLQKEINLEHADLTAKLGVVTDLNKSPDPEVGLNSTTLGEGAAKTQLDKLNTASTEARAKLTDAQAKFKTYFDKQEEEQRNARLKIK